MKRIQLFEFEDFNWLPNWLRNSMTRLIAVLLRIMGVEEALTRLTHNVLTQTGQHILVDLGSGAGGVMPKVVEQLNRYPEHPNLKLILTDIYPNSEAQKQYKDAENPIYYWPKSVNATRVVGLPDGLRTMVNCFHHMPPQKARAILADAHKKKQPLLIYEMGENKIPLLLWWLLLPISLCVLFVMVFFMTPFVRPLTWQQLVFTYIIPIIPLTYAWDGQASLPRMYTMADFDQLLSGLESPDYSWEKGPVFKANNKKLGTFVCGIPK